MVRKYVRGTKRKSATCQKRIHSKKAKREKAKKTIDGSKQTDC